MALRHPLASPPAAATAAPALGLSLPPPSATPPVPWVCDAASPLPCPPGPLPPPPIFGKVQTDHGPWTLFRCTCSTYDFIRFVRSIFCPLQLPRLLTWRKISSALFRLTQIFFPLPFAAGFDGGEGSARCGVGGGTDGRGLSRPLLALQRFRAWLCARLCFYSDKQKIVPRSVQGGLPLLTVLCRYVRDLVRPCHDLNLHCRILPLEYGQKAACKLPGGTGG